jgi:hypothetical protein
LRRLGSNVDLVLISPTNMAASYPPNPYPTVTSASPAPPAGPSPPSSAPSKPHTPIPNPPSGPRVLRPQPASTYTPYQPHQAQQPPQFGQHPYAPPVKNTAENPAVAFAESAQLYNRKVQGFLDMSTPYPTYRWAGTAVALFLFALRVVYGQGVSTRCLSIAISLPLSLPSFPTFQLAIRTGPLADLLDHLI